MSLSLDNSFLGLSVEAWSKELRINLFQIKASIFWSCHCQADSVSGWQWLLPFAMAIYGLFVISCHLLPEVKGLGDTVGKTAEMLQRNESLSEVRHDAICVVFWLDCWPLLNLVFFDPDPLPRLRICLFPRTSPLWLGQIEMHWFIWRSPSWKMRWTPSSGDKKSSICRLR